MNVAATAEGYLLPTALWRTPPPARLRCRRRRGRLAVAVAADAVVTRSTTGRQRLPLPATADGSTTDRAYGGAVHHAEQAGQAAHVIL